MEELGQVGPIAPAGLADAAFLGSWAFAFALQSAIYSCVRCVAISALSASIILGSSSSPEARSFSLSFFLGAGLAGKFHARLPRPRT